ncbi:hypothetical protein GCM10010207_78060 [Streptomyces atratus]|nr:hypothetical protein GCM10010207_78060 [Streptomyces atratus]
MMTTSPGLSAPGEALGKDSGKSDERMHIPNWRHVRTLDKARTWAAPHSRRGLPDPVRQPAGDPLTSNPIITMRGPSGKNIDSQTSRARIHDPGEHVDEPTTRHQETAGQKNETKLFIHFRPSSVAENTHTMTPS